MSLSVLVLERPGRWRMAGLFTIIFISILPSLPLVSAAVYQGPSEVFQKIKVFLPLLAKSMLISLSGAVIALVLGLASGVLYSLYQYRARSLFMFLFMLPLMVPPLLWSVSINNLAAMSALPIPIFHGEGALMLITIMITFPLVAVSTLSACSGLNSSQCDAVRLSAGEGRLFLLAARFALPPAAIAACLGGFLMLSSPGPAMGLGIKTAVSEILISFSALYDMKLAAFQCILLSSATLVLAVMALMLAGKRPVELLAASSRDLAPVHHGKMSQKAFIFNFICCLILVLLPSAGLFLPALSRPDISALSQTLSRTLPPTLLYAAGSAAIATLAGIMVAFLMGRFKGTRTAGMSAMLVIFSLPAALTALGFVYAGTQAPGWTDFIFRSPLAVCLAQGLRFFPLPALLSARFLGSLPPSWSYAAEIQGISLAGFIKRVMAPIASIPVFTGFLLVFLLSAADVGTVLLLHPPGAQNLPLAIFTIMANAPGSRVSQLCVLYLLSASVLLLAVTAIWNKKKPWKRIRVSR